jgi:shikimate kinase/3-dehydroquinate synthase
MDRPKPVLCLNGFMGTGKSTVGRRVAERAGAAFVDLDEAVEARAGMSIPDLFAAEGEAGFRRREAEELDRLLEAPGPRVVALGGGALVDTARRRAVLTRARVVTLVARPETIAARTAGTGRPLLDSAPDRLARIHELLAARAPAYAEAHARIATDDLPVDALAGAVLATWDRPAIAVALGTRSYAVQLASAEPDVAAAAVAALRPSATFVVTDENVARLWGAPLEAALARHGVRPKATVVLPPGEEHKRLSSVERALTAMVEAGADRDAVVIGHGGGVVTDMAGFAAATLLRGVRWVALPTTLLAMVDASVGGKTGVDLGPAKNAVGAFHQPSAVVIDVDHVTTETPRAYTSGLAEVIKSAALGDPALFARLEAEVDAVTRRERSVVEAMVSGSIAVKAAIVARDERESGDRALLNFGHTVGHALEAHGAYSRLTHGEAVSLGMVAALRLGVALGATDPALADRVVALLSRVGLPTDLDAQPLAEALPLVSLDKKRRGGAIRFVLLHGLGDARVREIEPQALASNLVLRTLPPGAPSVD